QHQGKAAGRWAAELLSPLFGFLGCRSGFSTARSLGNEPRPPLPGQIGPGPLEHDQDAIPKSDEIEDMNKDPDPPGGSSRPLGFGESRHRRSAADHRERTFVVISEGSKWFAPKSMNHIVCRMFPGLHGHGRDSWKR